MLNKKEQRLRRARQTRARIAIQGAARLSVFRSNLPVYASTSPFYTSSAAHEIDGWFFRSWLSTFTIMPRTLLALIHTHLL